MKRMKDYGGQAACRQLSVKYGESQNFYSAGSSSLAKRVAEATGCSVPPDRDNGGACWWSILYTGKRTGRCEERDCTWRLRPELDEAIGRTDMSAVELYARAGDMESEKGYWWLTANPTIWSFSDIKIGEEHSYTLYNENGNKRRIFQNFLDAREGDLVIGYEANPVKKVVAIGRITQANDGKVIYFEKTEGLSAPLMFRRSGKRRSLKRWSFSCSPMEAFLN